MRFAFFFAASTKYASIMAAIKYKTRVSVCVDALKALPLVSYNVYLHIEMR